jgi:Na+/H+-dicarboxylate symporter/ABC-type amino acid transport substrate-binding protein
MPHGKSGRAPPTGNGMDATAQTASPTTRGRTVSARLPLWVLIGAFLGILTGITFGERASLLKPLGDVYAMMLLSVVYPYIISSLIVGLGSLAAGRARRLLQASWGVYLLLWITVFATIFVLAQAIPPPAPPAEIAPPHPIAALTLLQMIIPENLIVALNRNFVPAIIVFAVLFGLAVQTIPSKASFLETMEAIRLASLKVWAWVIYLAPIGVFALFAATAGTIEPRVAGTLAVYMGLFLFGTGVLAFVVLPLVLSAIVPARARDLLADLQPAFVLALVTTLPTSALPLIQGVAERRIAAAGHDDEEAKDIARATISLSYVFVSLGNYFVALFIVFACQHYQVTLHAWQTALLAPFTLLSASGSPSTTLSSVTFMSQWLGLPADTLPLYVEAMTVTRYAQVALSVSAYAFVAIAVPFVYFGRTVSRPLKMIAALLLGAVLFVGTATGVRMLSNGLFPPPSNTAILARTLEPALVAEVDAVVSDTPAIRLPPIDGPATLDGIRERKSLRVGYGRDLVPFTYRNRLGELVGFDISYAYRLAHDLHVRLELVPIEWDRFEDDLITRHLDIVMAGVYVTDKRLEDLESTNPYFESPLAFIARSDRASRFLSYSEVADTPNLALGVLGGGALFRLTQQLFPKARIAPLQTYDELPEHPELDAAVWALDEARAWASGHTGFSAVAASGMGAPMQFAYFLQPSARTLTRYLNTWLSLQASNGFRAAQLAYWIDGKPRPDSTPRWNLLDNVLRPFWRGL